tara:strand:- start:1 stop:489 length:489 start_codon:yes stop_codon:yes gene_type:complete
MLKIEENITIDADINKIWAFLTDFSLSLKFNRFHTEIELPEQYSIGKLKKFNIDHNFGFGKYEMVAEITNCVPPNKICLWEYCGYDKKKGFPHKVEFFIEPKGNKCILNYTVTGSYGGKVQDMSFKPILKGVVLEELLKIKNAIEASENITKPLASETVKPI